MHLEDATVPLSVTEQDWHELSAWLFPLVQVWVNCSGVLSWRGQYKEIAEEIVQETVMRTFKYTQRAARGEVPAIISLKSLSKVIAQNHFRDRCKKDRRLIHPEFEEVWQDDLFFASELGDPSQIACDQMVSHATLMAAAQIVAGFPRRQKQALLTDLANTSHLDEQPTLLEKAFSEVGVRLRDYHRPLPTNQAERGKHSALLCIAYKRLRHTMQLAAS